MTFMRNLLNLLNMENWEKKNYINQSSDEITYNGDKYSYESLFYEIRDYWSRTTYNYAVWKYREPTSKEKKDYALIDILSCFRKNARSTDNFSPTLLQEMGITNWNAYFNFLLKKGYLRNANITEILLSRYTLDELKIIAESLGIKKGGKKMDLAERVVPFLPQDQVDEIAKSSRLYIISEKGEQILCNNEDYILLHKYRDSVSLAEFNDNRIPDQKHRRNFYDTIFQALSNQAFWYQSHKNFGMLSVTYYRIYDLLLDEEKNMQHNVSHDIILNNYVDYLYLNTCESSSISVAVHSGIFSNRINYFLPKIDARVYKLADNEQYINYDLIFCSNPPSLFTEDEFKSFIHEILTVQEFDNHRWEALLSKRITEFYNYIKFNLHH